MDSPQTLRLKGGLQNATILQFIVSLTLAESWHTFPYC